MTRKPNVWTPGMPLTRQNARFRKKYPYDNWNLLMMECRALYFTEVGYLTPHKQEDHFQKHKNEFSDVPDDSAVYALNGIALVRQALQQPSRGAIKSYLLLWEYAPYTQWKAQIMITLGDILLLVRLPVAGGRLTIASMYTVYNMDAYTAGLIPLNHLSEVVRPTELDAVLWQFNDEGTAAAAAFSGGDGETAAARVFPTLPSDSRGKFVPSSRGRVAIKPPAPAPTPAPAPVAPVENSSSVRWTRGTGKDATRSSSAPVDTFAKEGSKIKRAAAQNAQKSKKTWFIKRFFQRREYSRIIMSPIELDTTYYVEW